MIDVSRLKFAARERVKEDCDCEYLLDLVNRLENEKAQLQSQVELHKKVLSNSAQIISVMTKFFCMSFEEITTLGFDLNTLDTVNAVMSEQHINSLRQQVDQLREIEDKISQALPSVNILEEFLDLMDYLKKTKDSQLIDNWMACASTDSKLQQK